VSGINIYDLETTSLLNVIEYDYVSSVWTNDNYMYMATSISGIYRCDVLTVTGTVSLIPYKQYPDITDNCVYCIHGKGNYLCATTAYGVDHYDLTTGSGICTTLSGVSKCFQTERGEFYYTYTPLTADKKLHVVYDNTNNWDIETVGHIYTIENYVPYANWLSNWSKRIKLIIDDINIDEGLCNFPILVNISDSSGTDSINVTDIFDELTDYEAVLFNDTCIGTFSDNWTDNSNGDSCAEYSGNKLSLSLNHGGATEGVNALTKTSFSCWGLYVFEFDWYPVAGSSWFDDDFSDAQNEIDIVQISPSYNTGSWWYNRCEDGVGKNSKLSLCLRSSKSNLITIRQRINGGTTTLLNQPFNYGTSHHVKWVVDFNNYWTKIYMDGVQIGSSTSWNSSLLDYIGTDFKLNFHWHTYAKTANQYYNNITIRGINANNKKIMITTNDGITPCYVEIEQWDYANKQAALWAKVPRIYALTPSCLYLYYDQSQRDNTTYVGDTGDTPAQLVWDSNFKLVMHMAQDPSGGSGAIKDSTNNVNHGTPAGTMTSADLVDGKIGKAIDFDGMNDLIDTTASVVQDGIATIEMSVKLTQQPSVKGTHMHPTNNFYIHTANNYIYNYGGADYFPIAITTSWQYLSITYNGNTSTSKLCYNGMFYNQTQQTGAHDIDAWNGRISDLSMGANTAMYGIVDEVRQSSVVRSDAWQKATYYSNWDELVSFKFETVENLDTANINDLYITEKTSRYNDGNVIFLATTNGVVVIEEKPDDEDNSNFKYYKIIT
jgi:hypothetical protein